MMNFSARSMPAKCFVCTLPIGGECIPVGASLYHTACLRCGVCGVELGGKQCVLVNEKILCSTCGLPKCNRCRKPVTQDGILALEKRWHKSCFVCYSCNTSFDTLHGQFIINNEEPLCIECHRYHSGRQEKTGKRKGLNAKQTCETCKKSLNAQNGNIILALHTSFHEECFYCFFCQVSLKEDSFIAIGNKICCTSCSMVHVDHTCAKCEEEITQNIVVALKKSWHPNCLTCAFCNKNIVNAERVYQQENVPCCPTCVKTVFVPCFRPLSDLFEPPPSPSRTEPSTLEELLKDKRLTDVFLQFLVCEFCIEPLLFYMDVRQFQDIFMTHTDIRCYSKRIFEKYLQLDSDLEILSISFQTKQEIFSKIDVPTRNMFDVAIHEVLDVLGSHYFPKFLVSEQFCTWKQTSPGPTAPAPFIEPILHNK